MFGKGWPGCMSFLSCFYWLKWGVSNHFGNMLISNSFFFNHILSFMTVIDANIQRAIIDAIVMIYWCVDMTHQGTVLSHAHLFPESSSFALCSVFHKHPCGFDFVYFCGRGNRFHGFKVFLSLKEKVSTKIRRVFFSTHDISRLFAHFYFHFIYLIDLHKP